MKMPDLALPEGVQLRCGESALAVAESLAEVVAGKISEAIKERGRATMAVSGGSTPPPFFAALSDKPLDWARVTILLADERWVDEDDEASNTRLVRTHLLRNNAAAAQYVSLKGAGDFPEEGLAAVEDELATVSWPLDVLILGMGNDGHTASLFPDAPELAAAMDDSAVGRVMAMHPCSQRHARVTLVWRVLAAARYTALHIRGVDKLDALEAAVARMSDADAMPIRAFLRPGLQIFWSP